MKRSGMRVTAAVCFAALAIGAVPGVQAQTVAQILRETLRQQSGAERSGCVGVRRAVSAGNDATLVVSTAVGLGYNACQVIRCALEGNDVPDKVALCEKVIRGAVAAGVGADVISRCSSEVCDPSAVAAVLAATLLEPNYCYFFPVIPAAPDTLPPPEPVFDRSVPQQQQASPYTF